MRIGYWVLMFLIVLSLACGSSSRSGGASSSPREKEQPAAEEKAAFTVGQDVQVGAVRWKFLEAVDLGKELKTDNQFIEAKQTSGKFVQVRFEIENQGTEAKSYAGIELVDSKGRTFKRYGEAIGFIEQAELCILEQLNPNISKTCTEIFEVPADAAGIKASIGDLELFGSDEAQVDLGM